MAKVLIATLPPFDGGVPAKTRILAEELRRRGHDVTLAFYAPLSSHGHLCVPSWRIPTGARPAMEPASCFDGTFPGWAVGCWLPELEFPYYQLSDQWRRLAESHDRHFAVGGTVLISTPFTRLNLPHLVWYATDMLGDRLARRAAMAWPRRLLDRLIVGPVQAGMEREVLAGPATIAPVCDYGRRMLSRLAPPGRVFARPMPIPVQTVDLLPPSEESVRPGVIGFAGRMADPRKNVALLIQAVALARRSNPTIRLRLTGEPVAGLATADLESAMVEWTGYLPSRDLPDFYRSLDLFVIPSQQEGFGIVGMEAMAAGVPVVSTRCGGPEDYVVDGQNGFLCDSTPDALAERILAITADRALRRRLGEAARRTAVNGYGMEAFRAALSANWRSVWGDGP